ncbi:MAG: molecular chaperone DnaJ [Actinobacteria bacterium]|nr:molecular chaperone DnaJ [Actinomycetota bacterium]
MAPQREWFEKDYYKVLGVSEKAPAKDITRAYRKLARELHPDANPGDAAAEERFKEVSAAYDVVGDETRRKEYDEVRAMGPMGAAGFGGPGGPGGAGFRPGPGGFTFEGGDISDLLGGMFGGGGRRGGRAGRGTGPQRGADLEASLHLPFREAVAGVETTLHITSDMPCGTCHGSGSRPGTSRTTCANCHGRGVLDDNQGMFSFSQPCGACGGEGSVITDPCPTCRGRGIERRPREVRVRIPAGVADGQRIRLAGRGGAGRNGGPAGDLHVLVHVDADALFGRDGRNLTIVVPVTFSELALGVKLTVPTLDDKPVTLKIPAGTPTNKVFRVKGRGVATKKGTGDLLVTVQVTVPAELTKEQRSAIEALADTLPAAPRDHLGV